MTGIVWQEIVDMAVQYRAWLITGAGFVLAFFALWILLRGLRLWYWKVNERAEALHAIENDLTELRDEVRAQAEQNAKVASPQPIPPMPPQMGAFGPGQMPPGPAVQPAYPVYSVYGWQVPTATQPVQTVAQPAAAPQVEQVQQTAESPKPEKKPAEEAKAEPETQQQPAKAEKAKKAAKAEKPAPEPVKKEKLDALAEKLPEPKTILKDEAAENVTGHRFEDRDCARDKFGRVYTREEIEADIKA